MLSINTSLSLMIGQRSLHNAQSIVQQAAERIMTGKQINRASDDPSGLMAVSEMDVQIESLKSDIEALSGREALLGAQEGALSVMSDQLLELQGIVVTAANRGGLTEEEREALQLQADEMLESLDRAWVSAKFKGERLFDGLFTTTAGMVTYTGEEPDPSIDGGASELRASLAALASGKALNLVDGDLEAAQDSVESALSFVNTRRAGIGSEIANSIEPRRAAMLVELENLTQAKSDVEDADIAAEMANLVRGQILEQASIQTMRIAQEQPNAVLQLLESSVQIAKKQT